MTTVHQGACYCGSVQIEVSGEPEIMGFCHCRSCRAWSASPVHASAMWKPESVRIVAGREHLRTFHKTPESHSHRQFCGRCGGHLMVAAPEWGLIDVSPAILPSLRFIPVGHANYSESILPMKDGLPKYRDFPEELGESGELMPDQCFRASDAGRATTQTQNVTESVD
ncbi:MAG: GFA family protein [Synechococcaceae cyanobacterium]